jgi:hypothetical protein
MRAALLLVVLAGCADDLENAVLEVAVSLPPREPDAEFALVQVERSIEFAEPWPFEGVDGFALSSISQTVVLSVVADPPEVEGPLRMKTRFCRQTRCLDPEDEFAPEVRVTIERPFYLGERTTATIAIDDIPSRVEVLPDVAKCEIGGCGALEGAACDGAGRHACE